MKRKPNILFILADDQRFNTIHALGNSDIQTPCLDRLVQRGTAFTEAHIPGGTSGAVCMPSRAMLHSGRTLLHLEAEGQQIPDAHITLGETLRKNGYDTIGIGKWHNGPHSYARSFTDGDEIFFGGMWDHWNVPVNSYHPDGLYENQIPYTCNFFHANHPMMQIAERIQAGKHSTELFADAAIRFLEKEAESQKPFFLYTALLAPHDPRTMPKRFQSMYDPEKITVPDNFAAEHPYYGLDWAASRDEDLAGFPRTEKEIRQHIADYYAMISHIDENLGRILDTLEKTGQMENTIIVYAGDNGLSLGSHGLMGKQNLYDCSVHVPLILAGPGIPAGKISEAYVYLLDLYPTLCELCGIEIPSSVEGKSFVRALRGGAGERTTLYFAFLDLIRAVQNDRYKLILYRICPESNQLYDLQKDPHECVNLYADPSCAEIRKEMEHLMQTERAAWEDQPDHKFTKGFWEAKSGTEKS